MPRIRCHYADCVFLADELCGASSVEIDPDEGCLTYSHLDDLPDEEEWEGEPIEEFWEESDEEPYLEDSDLDDAWLEGEED